MNITEKFCLKWNDFSENVISKFSDLRNNHDLSDVTLTIEDGTQMEAHRIVLSTGSFFFRNIFKNKKKLTPIIYMRGLRSSDLTAIMDYLYYGEVNVQEVELNGFLSLANELQIIGLAGGGKDNKELEKANSISNLHEDLKPKYADLKNEEYDSFESPYLVSEDFPAQTKRVVSVVGNDDLKQMMTELIEWNGDTWRCNVCGKLAATKNKAGKFNLKRHTQTHMTGLSCSCNICEKDFKCKAYLDVHMYKSHKPVGEPKLSNNRMATVIT